MKAACPSCGADIEFRYDDSFVRVCDYCRTAVLRTDRGLDTLGKFADLVLLTADPQADIHNLRKVDAVMKDGRLADRAGLPQTRILSVAPR